MRYLLVVFLAFFLPLHATQSKPIIRALLVCDASPSSGIQKETNKDVEHVKRFLKDLGRYSHVQTSIRKLHASSTSLTHIQQWIHALPTTPNTIVVFYFAGHGFRNESSKSQWPLLYLSEIKGGTRHDIAQILSAIKTIALSVDLNTSVRILRGKALSNENITDWISSIHPNETDVIVFYYSGHGTNASKEKSDLPVLIFPHHRERCKSACIVHSLSSLNPRLVLVALDCCNTTALPYNFREKGIGLTSSSLPGLKNLFLLSKGTIVAVGASPGMFSYTFETGSLFTSAFLESLFSLSSSPGVSWSSVFEKTEKLCMPMQKPLIEADIQSD